MSDSGMIEGSAPSGETGGEYVTIHSADSASYEDTAFVYEYDEGVYETEEYTDVTTAAPSSTIAFGDTSALEYGGERAGCTAGACPHPVAHPAEAEWEQLVSAVPTEGQLHRFKPRCEGMSYPTEDDFRAAIGAVRPLDPDAFSLSRLRIGWQEEVAAVLAEWPGLIRTRLTGLAEGWAGEDFDLFTDRTDQMRSLVQGVLDDIEDTVRELENRESSIYTLQGGDSGEIPYPAPMVGVEGEWTNLVAIHVRPAWWHGDCILMSCEEAERALELGGADPKLATDVRTFIEGRAGGPIVPGDASEARVLAGDEAATSFEGRISAELAAYAERHAAIDEAIAEKRAGQSEQLESMRTTGSDRPCPDGADSAHMDTEVPVMEEPAPPVPPQATQDPSPVPPGGDGSVAADPSSPETTSEERSWEEPALAEDGTAAGGLAGGGGFGPAGGGPLGSGGAAAPAAGAGGGGPGAGVGFGGAPPLGTPGAGGAAPAGGPGASAGGGARTAVVDGARQQAAEARRRRDESDEDEETEDDDDLLFRETENVWGYVRPGDDPYA